MQNRRWPNHRPRPVAWALALTLVAAGSLAVAQSRLPAPADVTGFTVEITGAGSGSDVDSAWETVSGGALAIEESEVTVGAGDATVTLRRPTVTDLVLRGPLTAGRRSAGTNEGSYEVLENGAGKFRVEIEGAPTASANASAVTMDDLVIDERTAIDLREMTTGADWDYRVYGPGDAHYGSITIRSRVGKDSKELYQWWLDTSRGKNIRKSISVIALKRDGAEARRWTFTGCEPVRYAPHVLDGSEAISTEEMTARCQAVEFGGDGALAAWINDTVQGKPWKRTLTVKEILKDGSAGKTFTYLDCFPTRYVFPAFSASGTGNLYEEVTIKPIRLELS